MQLIVGLGNPGKQYENTRHNVGYIVIEELKKRKLPKSVVAKKTGVYMNESGKAVKKLTTDYRLLTTALYVVHDDLDIPLGQFKIQFAKGPKDHKGIQSIEETLGTNEFWRVRVGIENRGQVTGNREKGEEYVLQDWTSEERTIIDAVIKEVVREITRRIREA
ncbi:peptidyl-tRNA hydrolase [Candidatus Microgenomates bacterium]|nr:peptidyl-tRNA hydrolase [Candidatus Microgenomates bacterium]